MVENWQTMTFVTILHQMAFLVQPQRDFCLLLESNQGYIPCQVNTEEQLQQIPGVRMTIFYHIITTEIMSEA